jgi:hypothetical protein
MDPVCTNIHLDGWIPPSTEGSKDEDCRARSIGSACIKLVLRGQQLAVCIEDVGERNRTRTISLFG